MFKKTTILTLLLLCMIPCVASAAFKLPDTGQTKCYQDVDPYAEIACPNTGQDGAYSINPMSYTDNGGNGTVTDNNTGLMWQKQDDGFAKNWNEANTYCNSLDTGGLADWRVPSMYELTTLINFGTSSAPTIDPLFSPTSLPCFWTSATWVADPNYAWYVSFAYGFTFMYGGFGGGDGNKINSYNYVRCVRGNQITAQYKSNLDTVTDSMCDVLEAIKLQLNINLI